MHSTEQWTAYRTLVTGIIINVYFSQFDFLSFLGTWQISINKMNGIF